MPELPEVETVRRSLLPVVIDKEIQEVEIFLEKAVRPIAPEELKLALIGRKIEDLLRRGKYLIFILDNSQRVAFHLRMTGKLLYKAGLSAPEKHTTLILSFSDGNSLHFVDPRKFGTVVLYEPANPPAGLKKLGPEPVADKKEVVLFSLKTAASRRKGPIKGLLLDQTVIAGLGNIYADETLFRAGVHPTCPAREITAQEWERIYQSIQEILTKAINHRGTTRQDYVDGRGEPGEYQNYLNVYGRKEESCLVCGGTINYTRVAGRGTHYCPNCQPLKKV
jgi:formamidopyrimidine-DNA glycosylase